MKEINIVQQGLYILLICQATSRARASATELAERLAGLRAGLAGQQGGLTGPELERRRDQLQLLTRQLAGLRDQLAEPSQGAAARTALLADLGTGGWGDTVGGAGDRREMPVRAGAQETEHTRGRETVQVRAQQQEMLDEQDAGLDVLADIIRRQKGMGQDIYREVTQQNDLIDDIDDRVTNVNTRLLETTSNVRVVSNRDRTCGYWVVIILLAIAIITVLFI